MPSEDVYRKAAERFGELLDVTEKSHRELAIKVVRFVLDAYGYPDVDDLLSSVHKKTGRHHLAARKKRRALNPHK